MRTLDPDQDELRALLSGPDAPTWVVGVLPLNSWHIDDSWRLRSLVMSNYRLLTSPCGPVIWVRLDTIRARPELDCS